MKKKILTSLLFAATITSGYSFAGLYSLTHHSRANCINNETISWHSQNYYWLWVVSRHRSRTHDHQVIDDWRYTRRSAAVHWGEGSGGWTVEGHHWIKGSENAYPREIANEFVSDCSIYDGWWDY